MAEKVTGRSSHPSTNWLTWMYTFLPAGGAPDWGQNKLFPHFGAYFGAGA
jgi:hypothetical protein